MSAPAVRLGNVVAIHRDQRLWKDRPYVGLEDIESGSGRLLGDRLVTSVKSTSFGFDDRHVLYGRLRPYLNKVLLPDFAGHCSTEIFPLHPAANLDRRYLWYWLTSSDTVEVINATCTGARMPRANMERVLDLKIPLPALEEQRRIVAVLDEASDNLERARAIAKSNLVSAENFYKSTLNAYVSEALERCGPTVLSSFSAHITDGDHNPPPKAKSGIPFVTISNIDKRTGRLSLDDTFFVPVKYFEGLKKVRHPEVGDILYTVTGATLGVPSLVTTSQQFCFQRHIAIIKPKESVCSDWLLHMLRSPVVFQQATLGSTGTAQKTVSLATLRGLKVPNVNSLEQTSVAKRLNAIFSASESLIGIYQAKLEYIQNLRHSLLLHAFSGKLSEREPLAA